MTPDTPRSTPSFAAGLFQPSTCEKISNLFAGINHHTAGPSTSAEGCPKPSRFPFIEEVKQGPTPSRYQWDWNGTTVDFYRLCEILRISNHPQAHALKKVIRAGQAEKPLIQDITEAIAALQRWKDIVLEDQAEQEDLPTPQTDQVQRDTLRSGGRIGNPFGHAREMEKRALAAEGKIAETWEIVRRERLECDQLRNERHELRHRRDALEAQLAKSQADHASCKSTCDLLRTTSTELAGIIAAKEAEWKQANGNAVFASVARKQIETMAFEIETLAGELRATQQASTIKDQANRYLRDQLDEAEQTAQQWRNQADHSIPIDDLRPLIGAVGAVTTIAGMEFAPLADILAKHPRLMPTQDLTWMTPTH